MKFWWADQPKLHSALVAVSDGPGTGAKAVAAQAWYVGSLRLTHATAR